jgi:hypothetical protein
MAQDSPGRGSVSYAAQGYSARVQQCQVQKVSVSIRRHHILRCSSLQCCSERDEATRIIEEYHLDLCANPQRQMQGARFRLGSSIVDVAVAVVGGVVLVVVVALLVLFMSYEHIPTETWNFC